MTPAEVRAVIVAGDNVDGGCGVCSRSFFEELAEWIPEIAWVKLWEEYRGLPYSPPRVRANWIAGTYSSSVNFSVNASPQSDAGDVE